jgi:hypothetical protein
MVIWKAELDVTDRQNIRVPMGAKFLTAQMQGDQLCVWYECNPKNPLQERTIAIYGTGNMLPTDPGKYIATFQMLGGTLVFHVYDLYGNI